MNLKPIPSRKLSIIVPAILLLMNLVLIQPLPLTYESFLFSEKIDNSIITDISINNDTDFYIQALNHGWEGNGSLNNPYIIKNLLFTDSTFSNSLIDIRNTKSNFILQNISIIGGLYGIYFENVSNAKIISFKATNASNNNFYFSSCKNITISDSNISESGILKENVLIDYSNNLIIKNNLIIDSDTAGIKLRDSKSIQIINNTIKDNKNSGIVLGHAEDIVIKENIVKENMYRGISIEGNTLKTQVEHNLIQNNVESGVFILGENTMIFNNTLYTNGNWGLKIDSSSINTSIAYNNFIENFPTSMYPQPISDLSTSSVYDYNFFDDATGPDLNNDGIVDEPYQVIKYKNVFFDNHAQTTVYQTPMIHIITKPNGIFIDSDYPLQGKVNVAWNKSSDTFNHKITYSAYYSHDNGSTWILIVENLTFTNFVLDSTKFQDGKQYLLKIQATDESNINSFCLLDGFFTVLNTPTETTSEPNQTTSFEFIIFGLSALVLLSEVSILKRKKKF